MECKTLDWLLDILVRWVLPIDLTASGIALLSSGDKVVTFIIALVFILFFLILLRIGHLIADWMEEC